MYTTPATASPTSTDAPDGLLEAFWAYERALTGGELTALDDLVDHSPEALHGGPGGLLVGHEQIRRLRSVRGNAPDRRVLEVRVHAVRDDDAVVVALTTPAGASTGGRGLQTQLWRRAAQARHGWVVRAVHVSPPPTTFDATVWRVVGDPLVAATGQGPLDGEDIAVKDLFEVAGHPVGAGVPEYLAESATATQHAPALALLLAAGAAVRGIARTDQFAYSLAGDNPHYGRPVNAVVPGGLPGGSSSGSTTAVALGAATIGLATDTAGSVRVPASYQGLWGLRTTHGAVPAGGVLALAPDFDAVGLLTRDPHLLRRAAAALLGDEGGLALRTGSGVTAAATTAAPAVPELIVPTSVPGLAPGVEEAFRAAVDSLDVPVRAIEFPDLSGLTAAFRDHQAWQAWQVHGPWLTDHPEALAGAVAGRFEAASWVGAAEEDQAHAAVRVWRARLEEILGDGVLLLPSAASPAPRVWDSAHALDAVRTATVRLTCVASVTGRPALTAPLLTVPGPGGGPVGLCLIGPRDTDLALVDLAAGWADRPS